MGVLSGCPHTFGNSCSTDSTVYSVFSSVPLEYTCIIFYLRVSLYITLAADTVQDHNPGNHSITHTHTAAVGICSASVWICVLSGSGQEPLKPLRHCMWYTDKTCTAQSQKHTRHTQHLIHRYVFIHKLHSEVLKCTSCFPLKQLQSLREYWLHTGVVCRVGVRVCVCVCQAV